MFFGRTFYGHQRQTNRCGVTLTIQPTHARGGGAQARAAQRGQRKRAGDMYVCHARRGTNPPIRAFRRQWRVGRKGPACRGWKGPTNRCYLRRGRGGGKGHPSPQRPHDSLPPRTRGVAHLSWHSCHMCTSGVMESSSEVAPGRERTRAGHMHVMHDGVGGGRAGSEERPNPSTRAFVSTGKGRSIYVFSQLLSRLARFSLLCCGCAGGVAVNLLGSHLRGSTVLLYTAAVLCHAAVGASQTSSLNNGQNATALSPAAGPATQQRKLQSLGKGGESGNTFRGHLGAKNGVPQRDYNFRVANLCSRAGSYSDLMVTACRQFGMRPVCDHPNWCGNDRRALYLGQSQHISYPNHRNDDDANPYGFSSIRNRWNGLCVYAGTTSGKAAVCNIPVNSHSWKDPAQGNPGFVCGKIRESAPDLRLMPVRHFWLGRGLSRVSVPRSACSFCASPSLLALCTWFCMYISQVDQRRLRMSVHLRSHWRGLHSLKWFRIRTKGG